LFGIVQGGKWIRQLRRRQMRGPVREHKGYVLARCDGEFAHGAEIFAAQRSRRLQHEHLRSGDGAQDSVIEPRNPGNGGTVIESDDELATHLHLPLEARNDAHDIGGFPSWWHEVDEEDASFTRRENGLEDQSVGAIAPRDLCCLLGSNNPPPVFRPAEQRGKAGIRIESRKAKPIDRPIPADERGRFTVAYEGIVFNPKGHGS
jgi:hypothetical protein